MTNRTISKKMAIGLKNLEKILRNKYNYFQNNCSILTISSGIYQNAGANIVLTISLHFSTSKTNISIEFQLSTNRLRLKLLLEQITFFEIAKTESPYAFYSIH